jgi:thiamine kinase-like enzyme
METAPVDRQSALRSALTALATKGWQLQVVGELAGGMTNSSVIVKQGTARYVLRLNHPDSQALGIDRNLEIRIVAQLPAALRLNVLEMSEHFMLTPLLKARQGLVNGDDLEVMLGLLRQLHGKHIDSPPINYTARIKSLLDAPMPAPWLSLLAKLETALQKVEATHGRHTALCHHDLVAGNILWPMRTGALPVLIDWEYAAMGDLFFDLACLLEEHKHLALSEVELLQKYGVDPQCAPKLRVYRAVYSALAAAWARCRGLSNASQLAYIEALLND